MARLNRGEQEQSAIQLERTLMVLLVGVFVVVFLYFAVIIPTPRPEPLVEVPCSASTVKAPEFEDQVTISIQSSGATFVEDQRVTQAQLESRLLGLRPRRARDILIRARVDRAAPFAAVRAAVRAAQNAGLHTITILARPLPEAASQSDDFKVDVSPDVAATVLAGLLAAGCIVAAAVLTVQGRNRRWQVRYWVAILLFVAIVCALLSWSANFPSCPRGWWC